MVHCAVWHFISRSYNFIAQSCDICHEIHLSSFFLSVVKLELCLFSASDPDGEKRPDCNSFKLCMVLIFLCFDCGVIFSRFHLSFWNKTSLSGSMFGFPMVIAEFYEVIYWSEAKSIHK